MSHVFIRCDASDLIGSGHLARCMALAQALRARGAQVHLLARHLPDHLRALHVDGVGVTVHRLTGRADRQADDGPPLAHAHWLGVSQRDDAAECVAILSRGPRPAWIIVDHYALDARWERLVRPHADALLAIDDLADRDHACDALLDQNHFPDASARYAGRVPPHAELLLGPRYALLREEFARARAALAPRDGRLRRILVCFGSLDRTGQTLKALHGIEASGIAALDVDVVIGSRHPEREAVEAYCHSRAHVRLTMDTPHLCDLMARADLAIGASGSMNWERASLLLPAIVTSAAVNQQSIARALAADFCCIYLGNADEWRADALASLLRALYEMPNLLSVLGARAGALSDGSGAVRVARRLLPEPIELRPATERDCETVYAWRNAPEVRAGSFDLRPISIEAHRAWFEHAMRNPRTALLIGECKGCPVGVLRYDFEAHKAKISIYVVPSAHGRGLGAALLRAGRQWIRHYRPEITELLADVKADNLPSMRIFANCNFKLVSYRYGLQLADD